MSGGGEKAAKDFQIPFLGSIPFDVEIVSAGDQGKPFICNDKNRGETRQAFERIAQLIVNKINQEV